MRKGVLTMNARTILFMGPPGCGKGTHASRLAEEYGVVPVSVGELLRQAVKAGTEVGKKVAALMSAGKLVPDETAVEVVRESLKGNSGNNLLFDGFPRSLKQAQMLDRLLPEFDRKVDAAVLFLVSDSEVIRRISGRRIDQATGKIYHVDFNPPPPGAETIQRADDREEVVKERLDIYHSQTEPVAGYYRKQGRLIEIDGEGTPDEVYSRLVAALKPVLT
jgi:adenylate kinase